MNITIEKKNVKFSIKIIIQQLISVQKYTYVFLHEALIKCYSAQNSPIYRP